MSAQPPEQPINVAIKFPERIHVEWRLNHQSGEHEIWINFQGSDGSRITAILSPQQAAAIGRMEADDPQRTARDLYVTGHIEVDELEHRLDRDNRRSGRAYKRDSI